MERRLLIFILMFVISALSSEGFAQSALPNDFTVEGRLYQNDGVTPESSNVDIVLEVLNDVAADTCVLYSETWYNVNLNSANSNVVGSFALRLGAGMPNGGFLAPNLSALFASGVPINGITEIGAGVSYGAPCPRTPAATDHRVVRVKVSFAGAGTYALLSPDTRITAVPTAIVAENANSLQGKTAADFLLTNTNTNPTLNQTNVENVFSAGNYAVLLALLDGSSTQFIKSTPTANVSFNNRQLNNVADPTAAQDVATKNYSDFNLGGKTLDVGGVGVGIGTGKTLVWNGAKWVTAASAGVSLVAAGNGLTGGSITTNGTLSVDTGTTGNKILQLVAGQIPAVDGFLVTNVNAIRGLGGDVLASGAGTVTATIQPNAVNDPNKISNIGGGLGKLVMTDSTTGLSLGFKGCVVGEVLQWSASGWNCQSVATLLGVSGPGAGTYGGSTQVAQVSVDAQGRVTALTNVNIAFPVTTVAGKTGAVVLTIGDVTGFGTAVTHPAGTNAGDVLLLSVNSQLPSLDGSLLTGVARTGSANNFTVGNQRITIAANTDKGLIIKGASGQSASLFTAQDNGGADLYTLNAGGSPTALTDLANKAYVDAHSGPTNAILMDGSVAFSGNLSMGSNKITNVTDPTSAQDVATKNYIDTQYFKNGGNTFSSGTATVGTTDTNSLNFLTNSSPRMAIDSNGNVGIGTTGPSDKLHVYGIDQNVNIQLMNSDSTTQKFPAVKVVNYIGSSGGGYPRLILMNSRGNLASSSAIHAGDDIGQIIGLGVDGNTNSPGEGARITFNAAEAFNTGVHGGRILFQTTNIGSNSSTEKVRIEQNGNVGIGTTAPGALLDVNPSLNSSSGTDYGMKLQPLVNQSGTAGYTALLVNATQTGVGSGSKNLLDLQVGGVSKFKVDASGTMGPIDAVGTINTSAQFTIGHSTVVNLPYGNNSIALGAGLGLTNGPAANNTSVGIFSMQSTTIGSNNSAVGEASMGSNTTGINNTAMGTAALYGETTGNYNSAFGATAMFNASGLTGQDNTAMGYQALTSISGASSYNTAVGAGALVNLAGNFNYNTALGYNAGNILTGGTGNILIGFNAQPTSPTASYQINIGNTIFGNVSSGNVGIGTIPTVTLDINGQMRTSTKDNTGLPTIDWNFGNIQYTNDSCQSYTFNNIQDGASYTFTVKGATPNPCIFMASGLTFHFTPSNGPTNAGTHSIYTFFRAGTDVYVSWVTGL